MHTSRANTLSAPGYCTGSSSTTWVGGDGGQQWSGGGVRVKMGCLPRSPVTTADRCMMARLCPAAQHRSRPQATHKPASQAARRRQHLVEAVAKDGHRLKAQQAHEAGQQVQLLVRAHAHAQLADGLGRVVAGEEAGQQGGHLLGRLLLHHAHLRRRAGGGAVGEASAGYTWREQLVQPAGTPPQGSPPLHSASQQPASHTCAVSAEARSRPCVRRQRR